MESDFKQDTVLPQPKNGPSTANTYLNEEGFDARCRYAIDLAVEGVREIESGYISPRPICECASCEFKKVCTYAEVGARERYSVDSSIFVEYDKADGNSLSDGGDK